MVLLNLLFSHFWHGDRFAAIRSVEHTLIDSESLLPYLPIVLGEHLPTNIRPSLVVGFIENGRFLTEFGFASESTCSPFFRPDGYWRGHIWSTSTLLIIAGLAGIGKAQLAIDISRKFCNMATESGMAENYDTLTREGLRDRTYTWTASVFLILAHEFLLR